jgi:hypothetical protein
MLGFLIGAVTGGMLVYLYGERMRNVSDTTNQARAKVAEGLENVQHRAEGAIDSAKERLRSGLQAGQEYIRPPGERQSPS